MAPGGTTLIPGGSSFSNVTFHAWNGRSRTIGPIAAYDSAIFTVGTDEPTRIPGGSLVPAVFTVLSVSPAAGRFFSQDDARPGAPPVVVLSYALWRERFAADPAAVGLTLTVDEQPHVVVGIAPLNFAFPNREARLSQSPSAVHSTNSTSTTVVGFNHSAFGFGPIAATFSSGSCGIGGACGNQSAHV